MTDGDMTVKVHTPAGAFYEGTTMTVRKILDVETLIKIVSALDSSKVYSIKAVDISFYYNRKEVEPLRPVQVQLTTALGQSTAYEIVHLKNNGETEIISGAAINADGAVFTLESFSTVAAAVEQENVPKEEFHIFYGASDKESPTTDLTPGAPYSIAPAIPDYVFVNATVGGSSTESGIEIIYIGSFISEGEIYVYYRTVTDESDLVVHVVKVSEFGNNYIALKYLPTDNYYNINYDLAGDREGITPDDVIGVNRVTRAVKNAQQEACIVTIPGGYAATITRDGRSQDSLGNELTYTVSNNKIITKHGELFLEGTYTIPKTDADQTIRVTLTRRQSYTFDAFKFLSTIYTGGNSTTMGDNTVNANSSAHILGDRSLETSGNNKGKRPLS